MKATATNLILVQSNGQVRAHRNTCKRIPQRKIVGGVTIGQGHELLSEAVAASCCKPNLGLFTAAPVEEAQPEPVTPEAVAQAAEVSVDLAKAEHKALAAWVRDGREGPAPATPHLDALNATGTAATAKQEPKRGPGRPRHSDPRVREAFDRKKQGKRGKGAPISDEDLTAYVTSVFPGSGPYAEHEVAYWVQGYAVGKGRWDRAWDAEEARRAGEETPLAS